MKKRENLIVIQKLIPYVGGGKYFGQIFYFFPHLISSSSFGAKQ